MKARISARAQQDLDGIFATIYLRQGVRAAEQFLDLARKAAGFLVQNPLAGPHPRWATRHKHLRFWVISRTNFLIYYFADDQGVTIERVLDGRREVVRIMEFGREDPPE
jgi:plasmid stabilization system protein ParE